MSRGKPRRRRSVREEMRCHFPSCTAQGSNLRVVGGSVWSYCDEHAAAIDATRAPEAEGGDVLDRRLLRRVLIEMRVSFDDADAVTADMLLPPRRRAYGPAMHHQLYEEARGSLTATLSYLLRMVDDRGGGEPGDPAGNGGSPAH